MNKLRNLELALTIPFQLSLKNKAENPFKDSVKAYKYIFD